MRSLAGVLAAEQSAPTTTSLSPASSCKASHSPSAKVRTPPRRRSSSGAAGATQPRVAALPCWLEGCDASCDASESGAVATRSRHAARMARRSAGPKFAVGEERVRTAQPLGPVCLPFNLGSQLFFLFYFLLGSSPASQLSAVASNAACDSAAVCSMLCRRLHGAGFAPPHCGGLAVVAARHLQ